MSAERPRVTWEGNRSPPQTYGPYLVEESPRLLIDPQTWENGHNLVTYEKAVVKGYLSSFWSI